MPAALRVSPVMPRLRIAVLLALLGPLVAGLAACPQATGPAPTKVEARPVTAVDDPRAVNETGDLYVADTRGSPTLTPPQPASPGTGRPDETNGKCRLYAPELPDPECCERQLGFDVETVKRVCGFKLYLGESFQASCGFYFLPDAVATGTPTKWFRLATIQGATPKEAAEQHEAYTRKVTGDDSFTARPIPGIDGAYWSARDGLHWAFLPGWSVVRQFTWNDDSCDPDGVQEILRALIAAPEIAAGTGRVGLVPTSNPPPAVVPDPGTAPAADKPADTIDPAAKPAGETSAAKPAAAAKPTPTP